MKKFLSIFCILTVLGTGALVLATTSTASVDISGSLTLKYQDIDSIMRENSTTIKSLTATSEASAYEGVNPLTGEWYTGYSHESTSDKKQRLEDLEKEIVATINSTKSSFISAVNLEKMIESFNIDISMLEKSLEIQELLYSQNKISLVEYQSFQNTLAVTLSNLKTLETNLDLLKKSINISLGRDINASLSLNQQIPYDSSALNSRNYSTDYANMLNNSVAIRNLDDYLEYQEDIYDFNDNIAAKLNLESARLTVASVTANYELAFLSTYNAIDSTYTEISNATLLLENAKNELTVATAKYDSGMISGIDKLSAENEVKKAEINLKTAQNSFVNAVNSYNCLINGEVSND